MRILPAFYPLTDRSLIAVGSACVRWIARRGSSLGSFAVIQTHRDLLILGCQTCEERVKLIEFTRESLNHAGLHSTPIVAGVGGLSTRESVRLAHDAANAGA